METTARLFSDWLAEIVNDEIIVMPSDINAEARANMWAFSLTSDQVAAVAAEDVEAFVLAVAASGSQRLLDRGAPPMALYCWHDEMAAQLRFGIVSASHGRLPFDCAVQLEDLRVIVTSFLASPYHAGLPMVEFHEVGTIEAPDTPRPLPVWTRSLSL